MKYAATRERFDIRFWDVMNQQWEYDSAVNLSERASVLATLSDADRTLIETTARECREFRARREAERDRKAKIDSALAAMRGAKEQAQFERRSVVDCPIYAAAKDEYDRLQREA